ncbi:MAG TPA: thioredoxin-disulfide reductase [Candidatus Pacearchaeota archaeon]|nr:thioredoxin-disulfide reductase [Candidatus Pacearchaeota archaeon]
MEEIYDVLILGGGPAGLTAAIYTGRYNLKTLVVAGSFGGTANLAGEVENWPGFVGAGKDLMRTVKMQAKRFGAEFLEVDIEKVTISEVGGRRSEVGKQKTDREFVLYYGEESIKGKSLIVALGTEHRQLDIPGEKEFLGKGVSYCATCDGNFFKGKDVAVIGGADSAAKAAIYLADICEKVTVVYRKHEMRCEPVSLAAICDNPKIEILYYSNPTEVIGDGVVKGLRVVTDVDGKDVESVLDVSGVFIEAGATAATEVLKELKLKMDKSYIVTGKDTKTSVDGIFAAGDVTNIAMRQMITAAGEGAVAAKGAHEFIQKINS